MSPIVLEGELMVLNFVEWLNYYYFVLLDCFPFFLHFLSSLIKFILFCKVSLSARVSFHKMLSDHFLRLFKNDTVRKFCFPGYHLCFSYITAKDTFKLLKH